MTPPTKILTDEQKDRFVSEICQYGTGFVAPLHSVVEGIEQAVLQSPEVVAMAEARDVLIRKGFVRCDIPACNCGSWHARYGLPERMREIKDALAEAGYPLSNENGNLAINALAALVAERDSLKSPEVVAMRWQPIETAPKDFITEFDGWNGERVPNVAWAHPEYGAKGEYAWCVPVYQHGHGWSMERVRGLTHWMPLPAPPSDAAMQEQKP